MGLYRITGENGYFGGPTGFEVGAIYEGTYVGFNQVHLKGEQGCSITLPLELVEVIEHDIQIDQGYNRTMKDMHVIDCTNSFYPTDLEELTMAEYIELMEPRAIFHHEDGHYQKIWDERRGFVR